MKIQLLSDLHLEFLSGREARELLFTLHTDADVLILAGDIASGRKNVKEALTLLASHFPNIIYVMGNHETYGSSYEVFKNLSALPDNVHFLNPGSVRIDDVTFIGAPLWTNFREDPIKEMVAKTGINDFYRTADATTGIYKKRYYEELAFIQGMYEANEGKKVIITHFLPADECVDKMFRRPQTEALNAYFANDLGNYIATLSNTTWVFGHTHCSVNIQIGDTRLLCNPMGYISERQPNFNKHFIFEV
jgi:predicted phosphodiesterase